MDGRQLRFFLKTVPEYKRDGERETQSKSEVEIYIEYPQMQREEGRLVLFECNQLVA